MAFQYRRHFLYGISVLALLSILLVVTTFYFYDSTPSLHKYFPKERNDFHPHQNKKKVSCSLGACHFITTSPTMIFSKIFYRSIILFAYLSCHLYSISTLISWHWLISKNMVYQRLWNTIQITRTNKKKMTVQTPPSCHHASFEQTYHQLKDLHQSLSFKAL